jgi:hypothetical protein
VQFCTIQRLIKRNGGSIYFKILNLFNNLNIHFHPYQSEKRFGTFPFWGRAGTSKKQQGAEIFTAQQFTFFA